MLQPCPLLQQPFAGQYGFSRKKGQILILSKTRLSLGGGGLCIHKKCEAEACSFFDVWNFPLAVLAQRHGLSGSALV